MFEEALCLQWNRRVFYDSLYNINCSKTFLCRGKLTREKTFVNFVTSVPMFEEALYLQRNKRVFYDSLYNINCSKTEVWKRYRVAVNLRGRKLL